MWRFCKYFRLQIMSLSNYFKTESILPHPNGPLSQSFLFSSIAAANTEIKPAVEGILSGESVPDGGCQAGDSTAVLYTWLTRAMQFTAEERARTWKGPPHPSYVSRDPNS